MREAHSAPQERDAPSSRRWRIASLALGSFLVSCAHSSPTTTTSDPPAESVPRGDAVDRAAAKLAEGKAEDALRIIDAELAEHAEHGTTGDKTEVELHFARGVALQALGRVDEAVTAWLRASELDPEFFPALHGLGAIALERGDLEGAIRYLSESIRVNPEFADAHYNLALALLDAGRPDDARKALEQAYRLAPRDPDVLGRLGELRAEAEQFDEAIELTTTATAAAPEDPEAWAAHGRVLLRAKRPSEALAAFDRGLTIAADDVGLRLGRAQALMKLERDADAETVLAGLARDVPDAALVWLEWGTALAKLGRAKEGVAALERAIALQPDLLVAHVRRVAVLGQAGECPKAREAASGVLKTFGEATASRAIERALGKCSG